MAERDGNIQLHTASQLFDNNVLRSDVIGLARGTLLPSLGLHGGLSIIAYGIARTSDRVELKDYLWPTGMVLNAWWVAIGRHMISYPHISFGQAWSRLSYQQIALLGAATAWSGRLTYRIISRSLRRGTDDPRYKDVKTEPGFWNKAPFAIFLPEAIFQALITLPLVMPLSDDHVTGLYGASSDWAAWFRLGAAGIFATGLTMKLLPTTKWSTTNASLNSLARARFYVPVYGRLFDTQITWAMHFAILLSPCGISALGCITHGKC